LRRCASTASISARLPSLSFLPASSIAVFDRVTLNAMDAISVRPLAVETSGSKLSTASAFTLA
jgi:hypothetical protein